MKENLEAIFESEPPKDLKDDIISETETDEDEENVDLTYKPEPPKNPTGERAKDIADIYKSVENSRWIRSKLLHELDQENFNEEEFNRLVNNWNNEALSKTSDFSEGSKVEFNEMERISKKHGKLFVLHSKKPNSIVFRFKLLEQSK